MKKGVLIASCIFCGGLLAARPGTLGAPAPPAKATPDAASAWTPIGPSGGQVQGLAQNAKNPAEIYASFGSYPSQFFRSLNGGKTWTRSSTGQDSVDDIATDPKNANVVYALAGWRLLKSSNRGLSFPDVISFPGDFRSYNGRIAIHPANPKIIFIAGSFVTNTSTYTACPAVARSKDGGKTWTVAKFETTTSYGDLFDMAIHPKNPNVIYVCGYFSAGSIAKAVIYKSLNGGGSYKKICPDSVFNPGTYSQATALGLHPTDPNAAVVGYSHGVARTTNGGASWQKQSGPSYLYISAFATDKAKPGTYYGLGASNAEGYRGLWVSADGGKTWTNSSKGLYGPGEKLLVKGSAMIAGTWAGLFRSQNAGGLWTASHPGIRAACADSFAVAPSSPLTIYTEVANYAMFKTLNGGGSWAMCPYFYRCESILGFIVHPADPKKVFYLAGG